MNKPEVVLCWFRRDLRIADNTAFFNALNSGISVVPVFVFDKAILDKLEDKNDRRVTFIYEALSAMQTAFVEAGSTLDVFYGTPQEAFANYTDKYTIKAVYANEDYEPYARDRDNAIAASLAAQDIPFHSFKDHVIFAKEELLSDAGKPYTVFTPFSKKWRKLLTDDHLSARPSESLLGNLFKQPVIEMPSLASMGFKNTSLPFPKSIVSNTLIKNYEEQRNFPSVAGTSRIGVHLRFGTVSVRQLVNQATDLSHTFVNELIWRDFYHAVLWHFPQTAKQSLKTEYDKIAWRNNVAEFDAWKEGRTGYPLVDAGMRELSATGFMHNRVRMVVASFLTKHLLIDWRWGEAWFAAKLLDYDMAANVGGWQWAAGGGADAAPYFRIFNPTSQAEKFDPGFAYVKQWVPEFGTSSYPQPIVDHAFARKRTLAAFQLALKGEAATLPLFPTDN
jgi:deoxyribodipyrimidine photo-lyase